MATEECYGPLGCDEDCNTNGDLAGLVILWLTKQWRRKNTRLCGIYSWTEDNEFPVTQRIEIPILTCRLLRLVIGNNKEKLHIRALNFATLPTFSRTRAFTLWDFRPLIKLSSFYLNIYDIIGDPSCCNLSIHEYHCCRKVSANEETLSINAFRAVTSFILASRLLHHPTGDLIINISSENI